MKLIVLTVVAVAVFTVNCRDLSGGEPEDTVFTIEPEPFDENQLKDGTVQNELNPKVPMEVNSPDLETDEEMRDLANDEDDLGLQTDEGDFDPNPDEELRAMSFKKKMMNSNKMMNALISKLTIANAKMINFMTSSITNLTNANAEIKSELDSVRKHQGCPEGLFYYAPSAQCFLMMNDTTRNWATADKACRAKGLVLAHPYDPEGIRNYIVTKYGDTTYTWVGARGTGSCVKYQRSNRCIGSSNPLWYSRSYSTSYCLALMTRASTWKSYGIRLYRSYSCTAGFWALCEHLSE